jgi:hypothetical protein
MGQIYGFFFGALVGFGLEVTRGFLMAVYTLSIWLCVLVVKVLSLFLDVGN